MKKYYYLVNTFRKEDFAPIQLEGFVFAESLIEVVDALKRTNVLYRGWEFLSLYEVAE